MPTTKDLKPQSNENTSYPVCQNGWCKITDKFCQTEDGCRECAIYQAYNKGDKING